MRVPVGRCRVTADCRDSSRKNNPHLPELIDLASWHAVCFNQDMTEPERTAMIGDPTEMHFVFTVADQLDRQAPAGRLNRNEVDSWGSKPAGTKFAAPKLLPRLITVCAWCKGPKTQTAFGGMLKTTLRVIPRPQSAMVFALSVQRNRIESIVWPHLHLASARAG
jgi:hypothetical protein